jgi:uncharacterized protein involved in type VI secretion and phage assembly
MTLKTYWGKYRGVVTNNVDPKKQGRITAKVSDVLADEPSTWALPCMPMTGNHAGVYVVPTIGSGVWIEFEQGDPNKPVWTGGFWGSDGEVPAPAGQGRPDSPSIVLQTAGKNIIVISDVPGPQGGVLLKLDSGASISITDVSITLDNGKGASIVMQGPSVNINNGALVVT